MPYVCCCSAYTEKVFEEQAYRVGMDNFIEKPLEDAQVRELL